MASIRIEKWCLVMPTDGYKAPEQLPRYLAGEVYNHPRHVDGTHVTTSEVRGVRDGLVVTKSGSKYELGEVDEDYEKAHPGAKEAILRFRPV